MPASFAALTPAASPCRIEDGDDDRVDLLGDELLDRGDRLRAARRWRSEFSTVQPRDSASLVIESTMALVFTSDVEKVTIPMDSF